MSSFKRPELGYLPQHAWIGCVGMIQNWTRRGLDWILGSISLSRAWSNSGTFFLERWLIPKAYQCMRDIWKMPLPMCFYLVSPGLVRQLHKIIVVGPFILKYSILFCSISSMPFLSSPLSFFFPFHFSFFPCAFWVFFVVFIFFLLAFTLSEGY